jgi:hypothetical protein
MKKHTMNLYNAVLQVSGLTSTHISAGVMVKEAHRVNESDDFYGIEGDVIAPSMAPVPIGRRVFVVSMIPMLHEQGPARYTTVVMDSNGTLMQTGPVVIQGEGRMDELKQHVRHCLAEASRDLEDMAREITGDPQAATLGLAPVGPGIWAATAQLFDSRIAQEQGLITGALDEGAHVIGYASTIEGAIVNLHDKLMTIVKSEQ